jgi:hypothetical protein
MSESGRQKSPACNSESNLHLAGEGLPLAWMVSGIVMHDPMPIMAIRLKAA